MFTFFHCDKLTWSVGDECTIKCVPFRRRWRTRTVLILKQRQYTFRDLLVMDCIICREDIRSNGTGSCIPCGHIYHAECLIPWLKSHQSCPICRMKSTIDDLQILRIEDEDKKAGPPQDEIQTIARLVEKAKEDNSFVVVNPMSVEFPYIPPSIVQVERGHVVSESTETIVRTHRRRVIQAVMGYLLLVALILMIAFVAKNSVNDKSNNK